MGYDIHSSWSSPGEFSAQLLHLPAQPVALADSLENFMIHHAAARRLGFGVPEQAEADRNMRRMALILATILERDARSLTEHRDLPDYFYGSCHDFALLAVSAMRERGIEARLRGGFVSYHQSDVWMDHWLCEYRQDDEWWLLDAQMGARARQGFGIDFDVGRVPGSLFLSASRAWQSMRAGTIDAERCGVPFAGISGEWFMATAVMRELAALAAIEVLPWDYWGPGRAIARSQRVEAAQLPLFDALAEACLQGFAEPASAARLYQTFSWAEPESIVLSSVAGQLQEAAL